MITNIRSETFRSELRDAIMARVCAVCVDRQPEGPPCLFEGHLCGVFEHLEPLTESVLSSYSDAVESYLGRVRSGVCDHCENQAADGSCAMRAKALCPLNNYLSLVIQAIESVRYKR